MHEWTAELILQYLESFKPANNILVSTCGILVIDIFRIIKWKCFELPHFSSIWKGAWGHHPRTIAFLGSRDRWQLVTENKKIKKKKKEEERLIRKLKLGKYSPGVMQCWRKTAGEMLNYKFSLFLEDSKIWFHAIAKQIQHWWYFCSKWDFHLETHPSNTGMK